MTECLSPTMRAYRQYQAEPDRSGRAELMPRSAKAAMLPPWGALKAPTPKVKPPNTAHQGANRSAGKTVHSIARKQSP
jgi:hypothetical protein